MRLLGALLRLSVVSLGLSLGLGAWWARREFGDVSFEQLVFSTLISTGGLLGADSEIIAAGVRWLVVYPLLGGMAIVGAEIAWARARGLGRMRMPQRIGVPVAALIMGIGFGLGHVGFFDYLRSTRGDNYFGREYVPPTDARVVRESAKSLVVIYVESLVFNYRRADVFGRDLLAPLRELERRGVSFPRFVGTASTGWTIGAQVATQCGVPLRVMSAVLNGNTLGENVRGVLPSAVCFGDVLAGQGYQNVFLQGATLAFAGQGLFWGGHGYQQIYGREFFKRRGVRLGKWGAHDDVILSKGMDVLRSLRKSERPFNLTMVLLDTHHPRGLLSKTCKREGVTGLDEIIECTARQIVGFVAKAEREGLLDGVRIVIMGDHQPMPNTLAEKLERTGEMSVYNLFLGDGLPRPNRDQIVHFDLFPTLLQMAGFGVEGGRLGLGYAAFGDLAVRPPESRVEQINTSWNNPSPEYLALWL